MRKGLISTSIAAAALLLAAPYAAAQTKLPMNGSSPGDGPAESRCPAGQVLVGFAGRAGVWVDAIQVVCAPLLAGNVTGNSEPYDRAYGGPGGGAQNIHCPVGSILEDAGMLFTYQQKQLSSVRLACRNLATGRSDDSQTFGNPSYDASKGGGFFIRNDDNPTYIHSQRCPAGTFAIGFYGRVGRAVNSLGLMCDRVVAAAPEKPIKSTGKGPPAYVPPPPPKAISLGAKPSAGAVAAVPTIAPRQAIAGVWTTQTDQGARYRITLTPVNSGFGPNGMEMPIQVAGNIVSIDGNTQLDGGLQGVVQVNSRTLIFNYSLKNGDGGGGTFNLSADGQTLTGEGTNKAKQHFTWTGRR